MQFGYDDNKKRIRPSFSGQRATCPLCNGSIIGKCGDIYVKHWQHLHDKECDSWQEPESEWHLKWKAKFPEAWQEVIIEREEKRHIADVKTENGLVIEFQNSFISSSTIRIREEFYKNMIWVVNAITFKDNFKTRSVVKSSLRNIDQHASYELTSLQDAYEDDLKSVTDNIERNKNKESDKYNRIKYNKIKINKLNQLQQEHEYFTNNVIKKWSQGESYLDYETNSITNKVETVIKNKLYEIPDEIKKLRVDLFDKEQKLLRVLGLENYIIKGKTYKFVQFREIASKSFEKARAISKASRKTLFPIIAEFKSELEFQSYENCLGKFDFLVDPTNTINSYNKDIEERKQSIENLEESLAPLRKKIADLLIQEIKNKIQEIKDNTETLINEKDELNKQNIGLVERQAQIFSKKDKYLIKAEKKWKDIRFKIMKQNKGLYTFEWKYERKTWQAANSCIFFDTGESYLYEKIEDGVFKKTRINEFLEMHLKTTLD